MDIFLLILSKLLPLYLFIAMGYVAGKFFAIETKQVATLVIYLVMPFVFAAGLWQAEIKFADFSIFVLIFAMSGLIALISYALGHFFYKNNLRNLLASGLPTGNTGYFGIPIALALFDTTVFGIYLLAAISNTMYQITFGYYVLASGNSKWQEAVKKVLKLPALYGASVGILLSSFSVPYPDIASDFIAPLKAAFTVLGMMIIGLTLSSFQNIRFDFKFISLAMGIRFILWPLLAFGFVFLDGLYFNSYFKDLHPIIILFGLLPVGADFAIYAANLNLYPARAAMVVFISTMLAALIIPLVYALS